MKTVLIAIICLITSVGYSQSNLLKYDGLYEFEFKKDTSYYLRFFPDGKVIGVSSLSNSQNTIQNWFNYEHLKEHDSGFFFFDDKVIKIVFKYTNAADPQFYEGYINTTTKSIHVKLYYFENGGVKNEPSVFLFKKFN